ncbi:MAG: MXAN_6640 family putative metalloprotease [Nannocystaceae bacterium]|nr:MYXO-CTERM sorting domain-containing protein [bacterium]
MRTAGIILVATLCLAPRPASAEDRPTEGGLWSFDATDVVESWEEATQTVRVHYSVDGPNVTRLDDLDDDGVPDYAQDVAERTAESIALFVSLGFRAPVLEAAIEEELGGSPAYDVYLVDFGGAADGRFGVDGCSNDGCAGFYVVENDFAGYGYATIEEGITTVTSHESFHGVQAAYNFVPTWVSEGTATWAQRQFDENSADFVRLCNGLLADPGRPVYQPPGGPVPSFAYGTALWFDFLSERHDAGLIVDFLDAMLDDANAESPQLVFEALLTQRDDDLETAWATFARYNLATGRRAGVAESHPYAGLLDGIDPDISSGIIASDARFYPLAANYYNLLHPGGDVWFVADDALFDVAFSLHPVGDFADDGAIGEPIATWSVEQPSAQRIYEDLPQGGYWIVGALSVIADGPARANVCVSNDPAAQGCPDVPEGGSSSTGVDDDPVGDESTGTGPDTAEDTTTTDAPDPSGASTGASAPSQGGDDGCGCTSGRTPSAWWGLLVLGVLRRRRA